MLTRRSALLGACCFAHGVFLSRYSVAQEQGEPTAAEEPQFMCGTEDLSDPNDLTIYPYASIDEQIEFNKLQTELDITPYGTSFLKDRWTPQLGNTPKTSTISLGVAFLNGTSSQQKVVQEAALDWINGGLGKRFSLDFSAPLNKAQLRIRFDPAGGNWSYVGRNCMAAKPGEPTMNIAQVHKGVCRHEWGHTWGLQHEHLFPDHFKWNEAVVIADAKALWGWPEKTTRSQILKKLDKSAVCVGDPAFNNKSVMIYPIRSTWTTPPFATSFVSEISKGDFDCLAGMYNT